ncbi:MAG: histidine phosphatase family protein [Patescibacteria group bacterium]|nr:histidine phosphatase family protein [Patescibacteria group bacterium]
MRIYLIRHGESESDVKNLFGGDYDDHLTERGKEQAEALAKKLTDKKIEIIFRSPYLRASETAKILKNTLGIPIKTIKDLRERNNYGFLTGMNKGEAIQKYPKEIELLKDYRNAIKGAETYARFKERVIRTWQKIATMNYNTIAIITHGGPIRCVLREIIKTGELAHLGDCAILELEKRAGKFSLVKIENAELKHK